MVELLCKIKDCSRKAEVRQSAYLANKKSEDLGIAIYEWLVWSQINIDKYRG